MLIRLFHIHFPGRLVSLFFAEAILIAGALTAATTRFDATAAYPAAQHPVLKIAVGSVVYLLCMHFFDMYDSYAATNTSLFLPRFIQVLGIACLSLSILYSIWPGVGLRRGPFLFWMAGAAFLVLFWRTVFCAFNRFQALRQRALLAGEGPLAEALADEIARRPELGMHLVGYAGAAPARPNQLSYLGTVAEISSVVERERVGRVVVTLTDRRGKLPVNELLALKARGILVEDAAELYEAITGKIRLESLRPSSLLFSRGFRITRWITLYKRAGSIIVSVVALVLSAPLLAVAAFWVRLDSPGPVLFRQQRIGENGRPFTLYKFRSMKADPEQEANPRAARKNDERITRAGRWLRRLRIDELPQLFNILRGDMYLVGPRPFTPNLEADLVEKIPWYAQRWVIKPGVTGWAQINHGYCESLEDNIEKLSYDLFYIKNLSPAFDIVIMFQTVKTLLWGRGSR